MSLQLTDYFDKCRCCLESLQNKAVFSLTNFIFEKFFEITQTNLIASDHLSSKICLQCSSEITRIVTVRNSFIKNQNLLIDLLTRSSVKVEQPEPEKMLETFILEGYQDAKNVGGVLVKQEVEHNEELVDYDMPTYGDESEDDVKLSDIIKPELMKFVSKSESPSTAVSSEPKRNYITRDERDARREEKRKKKAEIENRPKRPRAPNGYKYFCDLCNKPCKNKRFWKEHVERVHERKRNVRCDVEGCDYEAYRQYEIELHKFNKHGADHPTRKEGYYCDTCGEKFKNPTKLREHIDKKHLGIKDFQCDHCPMRFYKKECLRKHIIKHIPKEFRDFNVPCDECGKMLFNIYTLKSHKELVHQRIKRFSCELCGKLYESRSRLKIHIDSFHKGLREIECNICGGKYTTKLALRGHIKRQHPETIGLKKETYPCEICGMVLPSKQGLQIHKMKHGEPQFACDSCDKKYFHRSKLLDHQAVHKVLDFKCEYCPRSFRNDNKLKHHYRVVHFKEKRTYRCEICNSTFTRRTTLRDHVLRQHPGIDETYKNELIARILQMQPEEVTGRAN